MYRYSGSRLGRRPLSGCISGLVVIILILAALGFVFVRVRSGVAISVGSHPSVIIHDCNEPINVRAGQANQVVLFGVFPQYGQDTDTSTIELGDCDTISGIAGATLVVPPETNLQLDTNDAITILGVSGTMNLSANGSRITLIDVTLEGQSKIDDNGGAITLTGNFARGSAPSISGNSGLIDLTLPANAAFHLKISGIPGPIISDFPGVQTLSEDSGSSQTDVGHADSGISVDLDLNDTAVILHKSA